MAEAGDKVYVFSDGTWGPMEYSLWPQEYNSISIHHAAIPSRLTSDGFALPSESDEYFWFRKLDFTERSLDKSGLHIDVAHDPLPHEAREKHTLGFLDPDRIRRLAAQVEILAAQAGKDPKYDNVIKGIRRDTDAAVEHCLRMLMTFGLAICTARVLQRGVLELQGLLNYQKVIAKALTDPDFRHEGYPHPFRGVFTASDVVVSEMFRVGVPVWYLRRMEDVRDIKILDVKDAVPATCCMAKTAFRSFDLMSLISLWDPEALVVDYAMSLVMGAY